MAIRPYEVQIATNPVGRTSSQFSTNMPEPDLRGIQRLAGVIGDIGEQQMKEAATKEAELAASTITVKNPDGSYARIDKPEGFGSYAESVFNQAVEKKYVNEVYRDSETTLNDIATNPALSPQQSVAQMRAHVDAVVKNIDPKYKDQITTDLLREFNQRAFAIQNLDKSQRTSAMISSMKDSAETYLTKAIDLWNTDNPTQAAEEMVKATTSLQSYYELTLKDPALVAKAMEDLKAKVGGVQWFSSVLKEVRQKVADKTIGPDEVNNIAQMMTVGSTPDGTSAFGVLESDIVEKLHPDIRSMFGKMLSSMAVDYSQKFATTQSQRDIQRVIDIVENGNFSEVNVFDISGENLSKAALTYGNPTTPSGTLAIAQKFNGWLPKELYQKQFDDISRLDPSNTEDLKTMERHVQLYQTLKSIPLQSGSFADRTDVLDVKTRTMMDSIVASTAIGIQPVEAFAKAKYLTDTYNGQDVATRRGVVYEATGQQNQFGVIKNIMGSKIMGVETLNVTVPSEAYDSITDDVAYGLHMGLTLDQAKTNAKSNFEKTWKTDKFVATSGGHSFTKNPIPMVATSYNNQTPTNEYIAPYIQQTIDQLVDFDRMANDLGFNTPKEKLVLGTTLKLVPEGNQNVIDKKGTRAGAYSLQYMDESGISYPMLGKDGNKILIVPAKAAELYRQHNQAVDNYVAIKKNLGEKVNPAPTPLTKQGQMKALTGGAQPITYDEDTIFKPDVNDILPSKEVQELTGRIPVSADTKIQGYITTVSEEAKALGLGNYTSGIVNLFAYESAGWKVNAKNPESSASGLGQMIASTWKKYGTDRGLARTEENELKAGVAYLADLKELYNKQFVSNPEIGDLYVLYNQGEGGGMALMLADPNANAIKILEPFYTENPLNARKAVLNNMPSDQRNANITVKQFLISLKSRVKG